MKIIQKILKVLIILLYVVLLYIIIVLPIYTNLYGYCDAGSPSLYRYFMSLDVILIYGPMPLYPIAVLSLVRSILLFVSSSISKKKFIIRISVASFVLFILSLIAYLFYLYRILNW